MLIEFNIGNFLSFYEIQSFHLQAASIRPKFAESDKDNSFKINEQLSLLKSKAVYGANASGKSNLVRAFKAMCAIVQDCLKNDQILSQQITPFLLQEDPYQQATFFQLTFIEQDMQYRYGFEATQQIIQSEWLFGKPTNQENTRERYYFKREGQEIKINNDQFKEGKQFINYGSQEAPLLKENTLFLSVVAAFNGKIAQQVYRYLTEKIQTISGLVESNFIDRLHKKLADQNFETQLKKLIQAVDPTIQRFEIKPIKVNIKALPNVKLGGAKDHFEMKEVILYRNRFNSADEKNELIPMLLSMDEAEGTRKIFGLSPTIFDTFEKGGVLIIDEFDAKLHPNLTRKIVELFHSTKTNPNHAQLIFITHDSNLLTPELLRRDQITFIDKNQFGASELSTLVEFKGVRNNAPFEKDYLLGKYSGVPNNLNILEEAFENYVSNAQKDKGNRSI